MSQLGFFDTDKRLSVLSAKGDPFKLIRDDGVSVASVHDSQKIDDLANKGNKSRDVYADSVYRSAETEQRLKARGVRSRIKKRGRRNRPLTGAGATAPPRKSKVRTRIEHVFGVQENAPGGRLVRTIGIVQGEGEDRTLAYNIRRLVIPGASGSRLTGGVRLNRHNWAGERSKQR